MSPENSIHRPLVSDELAFFDATAQADLVRSGEVQALELVDAAIARIEKLNPTLNAVITHMSDAARTAARCPLPEGPFRGVPFLLKDLIASCAGVRMASGSLSLQEFVRPMIASWSGASNELV